MASIDQKNGIFVVRFRHGGKQYKKSLRTSDKTDADGALHQVQHTIYRLTTGQLEVPPGVDPGDFIVSGGKLTAPPLAAKPPVAAPRVTLVELIEKYLAAQFTKAESSVSTERTHLTNLKRCLGDVADYPVDEITHAHLTAYLHERRKNRRADTVKKERMTVRQLFAWACAQDILTANPAADLPKIKGSGDHKNKFKTIAEIEAITARGGLTPNEQAGLWECLYLEPKEIAGLLRLVRERATEDFGRLLHLLPAYTGMRRGEVLRLQWKDVDLAAGIVTARSRKQSHQVEETSRDIDLHPELHSELAEWRKSRPKGQFVVCRRKELTPLESNDANRTFWRPLRGTPWELDGKKNWFKLGFHSYRHSFASNLARQGVAQAIIDQWMGHQTEAMRKRYRHLFPQPRRMAIESFSLATSLTKDE
jgi:integrase